MIRRIILAVVLTACCTSVYARGKLQGYAERGGQTVSTGGMVSTTKVQRTFVNSSGTGATVTVYLSGTVTLATIYSDATGTAKANPFSADSTGFWFFYAEDGDYDVKFSDCSPTCSISTPWTLSGLRIVSSGPITVNVKDFGCKSDGSNDCGAIINTILSTLSGAIDIYVPAGTYKISTVITLNRSSITLRGSGESVTTFTVSALATDAIRVSGTGLFGINLSDFTLNCTGQTGADSHGIRVNPSAGNTASRVVMKNLRIFNAANDDIRLGPSGGAAGTASFVRIENCQLEFAGQVGPAGSGIGASDASDLVVIGCIFNNNVLRGIDFEPGAVANAGTRFVFSGNHFNANTGGMTIFYGFGAPPIDAQGQGLIADNVISGDTGAGVAGIAVIGERNVTISGNTITSSGGTGSCVTVSGGSDNVTVTGNTLSNCSTAVLEDGATTGRVAVTGNTIYGSTTGVNQTNGATRMTVVGNTFWNNTTDRGTLDATSVFLGNTQFTNQTSNINGALTVSGAFAEYGRSFNQGVYQSFAGTFAASSGTWTSVTAATLAYTIIGKKMTVVWWLGPSTLSATPASISIAIPGGFIAAKQIGMPTCRTSQDGSTFTTGFAYVLASGTTINIQRDVNGTAWTATATIATNGALEFEVQ